MTAATPKPMSKGNALAMALAGKIAPSVPLKASMEVCTSITRSKNVWRASPDGRGGPCWCGRHVGNSSAVKGTRQQCRHASNRR
jgi:hypothetical protein